MCICQVHDYHIYISGVCVSSVRGKKTGYGKKKGGSTFEGIYKYVCVCVYVCVCLLCVLCVKRAMRLTSVRSRQMSVPQTPARMVLLALTSSIDLSEFNMYII